MKFMYDYQPYMRRNTSVRQAIPCWYLPGTIFTQPTVYGQGDPLRLDTRQRCCTNLFQLESPVTFINDSKKPLHGTLGLALLYYMSFNSRFNLHVNSHPESHPLLSIL
jgi:hypothetical protein